MNSMNYYELLGVEETASKDEIKRAYVIKGQNNGNQPSKEMKQALLILTDPLSRIQYDRVLASEQTTSSVFPLHELKKLNYYERLKINAYANQEAIKKSYYEQIKIFSNELYPDHFILIREAYEVLSDPIERKRYSSQIEREQSTQSSSKNQDHQSTSSRPPISLEKLKKMNYYERLNINKNALQVNIKKAYHEQINVFSNELYPDHFILIREAYDVLSDPEERKKYRAQIEGGHSHQSSSKNQRHRSPDSTAPISLAKLKRMNYFDRLNVNPYASTEKIKESYYKQIKRFNNEVFPEHFLLIKEAYEYLSDPVRRKNYLNELNPTTSNHQSERSTETHSAPEYDEESDGYPTLGWIIAIFGSFMFTPVIAIPLGIAVGMGFARAFKAVGTIIVIGLVLLFFIALLIG